MIAVRVVHYYLSHWHGTTACMVIHHDHLNKTAINHGHAEYVDFSESMHCAHNKKLYIVIIINNNCTQNNNNILGQPLQE